jgi:hypothetical protein
MKRVRVFRGRARRFVTFVALWALALNVVLSPIFDVPQPALDTFGQPICAHHSASADGQSQRSGTPDGTMCCQCCGTVLLLTDTSPQVAPAIAVSWVRPTLVAIQILLPRLPRHPASPPRGPPSA